MDGEFTHREYNAQFVTDGIKSVVKSRFGLKRLKETSDQKNLNSIPLKEWDDTPIFGVSAKLREAGDYLTAAGKVCILKEAARQLIEQGDGA